MTDPSKTNHELSEKNSISQQKIAVRMDNILNRVILILSILTILGLIATPFLYQRKMGSIVIILALMMTMIVAKILLKRSHVRLSGIYTVSSIWLIFALIILAGGGLDNINVVFFISLAVMAGLLFGEKATILVAGAGIAMGFGLALMTNFGYLPPPYFLRTPFGDWAQLVLALVLTASTLNIALRDRDNALNMAEQQLSNRLEADKALRRSEERYRSLVENADEIIMVIQDGMIKFMNSKIVALYGYSEQELLSMPVFELLHPEDRAEAKKQYVQKMNGEAAATRHTYRAIHKNGQIHWIEISSVLIDWESRPALLDLITDITERKRAEEALQESEANYRQLFDNSPAAIYQIDFKTGKFLAANDVFCKYYGCSPEEIGSISPFEILTEESQKLFLERVGKMARGEEVPNTVEYEGFDRKGKRWCFQLHNRNIYDAEGQVIASNVVAHDVTERKRAEERSRQSEEKFHKVFMTSPECIAITRMTDGLIVDVNTGFEEITGWKGSETVGIINSYEMKFWFDLADRDFMIQELKSGRDVLHREFQFRRKDGAVHTGIYSARPITIAGEACLIFSMQDITERKQLEEERLKLKERLNRAEKMEALGQLAGGVAHDLNNVLGVLTGYSELLLMEIPEGQKARSHAEKIMTSTEKGAAIIQDLLTLARRGVTASNVVNLNQVVEGFLTTPVFESLKEHHPRVTFRTEFQEALLNIKGSAVHLEKTLMNLVSNAAESIAGEGEVAIRTENRYLDRAIRGYDEVREGDYAILIVSDTGMGIPAEHIEKIFEPFYTKKTMGKSGTGLGLAIVWGTVKDHNGYIDMESKVGEGTTFKLYFPVTRDELTAPERDIPIEQYMGNGESVLVVDDIVEQRDVASGLLTKLGYVVHTVSSGEAAVEYLQGNKADILVLDMIMVPGIDGLETYQRILEINPQQKAILVSGFSETDRVKEAQRLGAGTYVKKPYVMEKIAIAIRDELYR